MGIVKKIFLTHGTQEVGRKGDKMKEDVSFKDVLQEHKTQSYQHIQVWIYESINSLLVPLLCNHLQMSHLWVHRTLGTHFICNL